MRLTPLDYSILAAYLAFTVWIGWRLRRRVSSGEDFLTGARSIPAWMASLAFLAANLGAQEVIGMCASGAKYGVMTAHFYWIGAVPAMLFVGVFMMPFYYGSRARSVPEYLKLRFDEKTRTLNAATFAAMTIFSSGISMYALGLLLQSILGWSFTASVLLSAAIVLAYTWSGGLRGAIYNEVLQFFLIVAGFAPLAWMAVSAAGGLPGVAANVPEAMAHAWRYTGSASENPMGVEIFGLVAGLGFVLSFGYWCTDFLVVQRAMAAQSMPAARQVPVWAAIPKMLMPFVVIAPGVAAVALMKLGTGYELPAKGAGYDYDQAMTSLMARFYSPGWMGLGVTALFASFMSGMAGNVTAFNAVFTYDLYQSHIRRGAPDSHYLAVGRATTVWGIALSIGTAYLAREFNNIMDFLQLVFGFVNAPLFATFLLGMFWKRGTGDGAFWGLVSGTAAAALTHGLTAAEGKGGWIANLAEFPSTMAQNFWIAIWAFSACFAVTVAGSLATKPKTEAELHGLVRGLTAMPDESGWRWYRRPAPVALAVLAAAIAINWVFA